MKKSISRTIKIVLLAILIALFVAHGISIAIETIHIMCNDSFIGYNLSMKIGIGFVAGVYTLIFFGDLLICYQIISRIRKLATNNEKAESH